MKRILSLIVVLGVAVCTLMAQNQAPKRIIVPGQGGIDVEKLKDNIDLNMDVSKLNLNEKAGLSLKVFLRRECRRARCGCARCRASPKGSGKRP